MRKDRLRRLQRGTQAAREMEIGKAVFLHTMAQIGALADGVDPPPPPHPRAGDRRYRGTICGEAHRIAGGGSDPVPDLSEASDGFGGTFGEPPEQ